MNKEPLLSSAVFDCLRNLAIEPYAKRGNIAREAWPLRQVSPSPSSRSDALDLWVPSVHSCDFSSGPS
jgi:hypothetical protein